MKKITILLVLFIMSICFTGCSRASGNMGEKIAAPVNMKIPIEGKWKVESFKIVGYSAVSENQAKEWLGKIAQFNDVGAIVGEDMCKEPSYKVKKVNAEEYFLYGYKVNKGKLGINSDTIEVVTVTSLGKFFYEFVKIDDKTLIFSSDGGFYYLKFISDKVDDDFYNKDIESKKMVKAQDKEEELNSGVLLGLRSYKKAEHSSILENDNGNNLQAEYRTLWISSKDRKLNHILSTEDLFVPRMNGFWKIGVKTEIGKNYVEDLIFSHHVDKSSVSQKTKKLDTKDSKWDINKTINYVGNDYISVENKGEVKLNNGENQWNINNFKLFGVDNIVNENGIKISDIEGKDGADALKDGASAYVLSLGDEERKKIEKEPRERNFTIIRHNGHWIFKGRLNYINEDYKESDADFSVPLIPSKNIVFYDELKPSWNVIKEKVPYALDACTSPNNDMVIIITKSNLLIYGLKNNEMSQNPIKSIKINEGESIVMAEWATGEYVENWSKSFKKNKSEVIN